LAASLEPGAMAGTATCHIDGGEGQFAAAVVGYHFPNLAPICGLHPDAIELVRTLGGVPESRETASLRFSLTCTTGC
jgi:hypothetical protein